MKISSIEKIMHLKGFSKDWVATQLDMSERQFGRYMSGESEWTLTLLEQVAKLFEMTVPEMLSFDEKMVFNQCHQANTFGPGNAYYEGNTALVAELKERIKHLESEVEFLRRQLEQPLARG